jgi:hypothetical protein
MPNSIPGRLVWRRDLVVFTALGAIILASRLPFLDAGHGIDADGWQVAVTARKISLMGTYMVSRFPGYPLQEILYSLIWKGGPLAFNGITAILSAAGIAFFGLIVKSLGSSDYVLAAFALAFTPIIFINSTNSMDYVWALSFIVASYYFIIQRRSFVAGLFLGAAVGTRITSAAMFLPFGLMLLQPMNGRSNMREVVKLLLGMLLVAAASFAPVIAAYGTEFLTFSEGGYPSLIQVVRKSTLDVWGIVGLLAIAIALATLIFQKAKTSRVSSIPPTVSNLSLLAWMLAVLLYAAVYLRLPHEAEYLIPALPFAILILARFLARRTFKYLCIALMGSSFILSLSETGIPSRPDFSVFSIKHQVLGRELVLDPLFGPILANHSRRMNELEFTSCVLSSASNLPEQSVVIAGWWAPQLVIGQLDNTQTTVEFAFILDVDQIHDYLRDGRQVYFIPGLRAQIYNESEYGIDLRQAGARQLEIPVCV